jgi:hypothetical protein
MCSTFCILENIGLIVQLFLSPCTNCCKFPRSQSTISMSTLLSQPHPSYFSSSSPHCFHYPSRIAYSIGGLFQQANLNRRVGTTWNQCNIPNHTQRGLCTPRLLREILPPDSTVSHRIVQDATLYRYRALRILGTMVAFS